MPFTTDSLVMPTLLALALGFSAALVAWLVSRAIANVPPENRDYKDPPPLGFRLVWTPIQWLAHFIAPRLSAKRSGALLGKLRKAGLDYVLSPAQFVAARVICALLMALAGHWTLDSFTLPGAPSFLSPAVHAEAAALCALSGWAYPAIWLHDRLALRRRELLRTLPFFLDLITLCVEAGLNLQGAISQAVAKGPGGVLHNEFLRVLRDIRAGKARAEALRSMAARIDEASVGNFVSFVIQAETMGMNLGPVLRAQAEQRRAERFLRAEKLAMEAPVKMLFPLIAFIFPCTFIVLFFPIAMQFMNSGL